MTTHLHRRALFAGAGALLAAGCATFPGPPEAPKLYVLDPALPRALPGAKVGWSLSIQAPEATAGLDSERIAILRSPSGMDYFADAAWPDRLTPLVQTALLEAFEASGRIAAVARDSDGARADCILITDLREFDARYDKPDGAPTAVVRFDVRLLRARSRDIVGHTDVAASVPASANSVEAAVAALNQALAQALAQLVPWVLDQPAP